MSRTTEIGAGIGLIIVVSGGTAIIAGKGGTAGTLEGCAFLAGLGLLLHASLGRHWSARVNISLRERLRVTQAHGAVGEPTVISGRGSRGLAGTNMDPMHPQSVLIMDADGIRVESTPPTRTQVANWSQIRQVVFNWPYVNSQTGRMARIVFMPRSRSQAEPLIRAHVSPGFPFMAEARAVCTSSAECSSSPSSWLLSAYLH